MAGQGEAMKQDVDLDKVNWKVVGTLAAFVALAVVVAAGVTKALGGNVDAAIGFVSATGIGAILIQGVFTHVLSADLERYKSDLKTASDREVAQVRHVLNLASIAHEQTWRVLQARRATKIEELHIAMIDFLGAMEHYSIDTDAATPIQIEAREKKVAATYTTFMTTWLRNRIYLQKDLSDKMEGLGKKVFGHAAAYHNLEITLKPAMHIGNNRQQLTDALMTMQRSVRDAATVGNAIEDEFRKVLGVQSENKEPPVKAAP